MEKKHTKIADQKNEVRGHIMEIAGEIQRFISQPNKTNKLFKKSAVEPNVRIWSKREESVQVVRKIATEADNLLAPAYEESGAVEGILERLDAHGKLQFVIYDVIDGRAVKCEVNESQLQQALGSFQKRVEVVGTVRYRKDGMPVSIKASRIINFPEPSEIPTLAQMRELLAGGRAA